MSSSQPLSGSAVVVVKLVLGPCPYLACVCNSSIDLSTSELPRSQEFGFKTLATIILASRHAPLQGYTYFFKLCQ